MRKVFVQEKKITLLSRFCAARNVGEVENIVMDSELGDTDNYHSVGRKRGGQQETITTAGV